LERSTLLNKLKNASHDGKSFSIVIGTSNEYADNMIINTAKFLQSEMYIRLTECEKQSDGVRLSGKIEQLKIV
jgi:hypothetical protein